MPKPYWIRRRFSCPDCGEIYAEEELQVPAGREILKNYPEQAKKYPRTSFTCRRCSAAYSWEEFFDENQEKWSTRMAEEAV